MRRRDTIRGPRKPEQRRRTVKACWHVKQSSSRITVSTGPWMVPCLFADPSSFCGWEQLHRALEWTLGLLFAHLGSMNMRPLRHNVLERSRCSEKTVFDVEIPAGSCHDYQNPSSPRRVALSSTVLSTRRPVSSNRGSAFRCPAVADASRMEHCARQLYEVAWSTGEVDVLNEVMSEAHSQKDMLHTASSSEGRKGIQTGISRFRDGAGSITFQIQHIACDQAQQTATVEWKAALEGRDEQIVGASVLKFEEGSISETRVYRQST